MPDKIFEKIMTFVADGYIVEIRPDFGDDIQIRLRKNSFNVARVVDIYAIKRFQKISLEEAILRELDILKYEYKRYSEKENKE